MLAQNVILEPGVAGVLGVPELTHLMDKPSEKVVPLLDLHSPSLQIPFPSDLNTDLVVEKGGRVKFMLVLGSLQQLLCGKR
ncbi:hypothetical protein Nmel_017439 [Mimus melanotis]